ncbi:metallophosphoesterase [Paenibacillus sp. NAIST15-1]|uniref:metallophosphoesterase n=1 Tax=Paenibacillus sp. NAIST15-1 TaxID=1605994 RepID=UPI00086CDD15|nr:metallophosphoesterase [Paenibacillus sp. NAIST15-1]GAV11466.1 putative metallophosphoesterase [Paenibacillus sp. NAIST15-1]
MNNVWFISDPHFGHKNIIKYENRPFVDVEHMDNVIIENYNKTVNDGDMVFWLGDMFFCNAKRIDYISNRLKSTRNILIRGNHDKGITDGKFKKLGFMPYKMYQWGNCILTHEPLSEVNLNYLKDIGIWLNIHGHTHSENQHLDPKKYFCASVENTDYRPINATEIEIKVISASKRKRMQ